MVESVVAEIARRQRAGREELAEFRSLAFLKLVEGDYAVLQRFQGHSSLRTYLAVVLQRVLLDHRNREWGRWRASAAAQRLGPVAVQLDRLITRDGLAPQEALDLVSASHDVSGCRGFVEALQTRSQSRGARWMLGEEAIPESPDPGPGPDATAADADQQHQAAAVEAAVGHALRELDAQDHLILTLHFRDGLSIADVARVTGLEAKPLYRRIQRILQRLRDRLSGSDAQAALVRELAGLPWSDFVAPRESGWWRSSTPPSESATTSPEPKRGVSRRGAARGLHRGIPPHALSAH